MLVTSTKNKLQEFYSTILSHFTGDAPPANCASKRQTEAEFSVPDGPVRRSYAIVDYIPLSGTKNLVSDCCSLLCIYCTLHGAYCHLIPS
jgi:hypothetical protein